MMEAMEGEKDTKENKKKYRKRVISKKQQKV